MTEESSDFLTTTISNFQNLPEISLRSINNYPDIIDLTEDDDDSNNVNPIYNSSLDIFFTLLLNKLCYNSILHFMFYQCFTICNLTN